jgi:hypothetical protein
MIMLQLLLMIFLAAMLPIFGHAQALQTSEGHSDMVIENECSFILRELRKLSDSTVYSTLQISKVHSSVRENGIFHDNLIMEVELTSPFFKSGLERENFTVVVMTNKADRVKSLAIDEFPVMRDVSIESFYNEKVERKRRERERSLRWLDIEASNAAFGRIPKDKPRINHSVSSVDSLVLNTLGLLEDLDSVVEIRRVISDRIRPQLPSELLDEEEALSQMTLRQLYMATVNETSDSRSDGDGDSKCVAGNDRIANRLSEYQKYRARKILDSVFSGIHRESYAK